MLTHMYVPHTCKNMHTHMHTTHRETRTKKGGRGHVMNLILNNILQLHFLLFIHLICSSALIILFKVWSDSDLGKWLGKGGSIGKKISLCKL